MLPSSSFKLVISIVLAMWQHLCHVAIIGRIRPFLGGYRDGRGRRPVVFWKTFVIFFLQFYVSNSETINIYRFNVFYSLFSNRFWHPTIQRRIWHLESFILSLFGCATCLGMHLVVICFCLFLFVFVHFCIWLFSWFKSVYIYDLYIVIMFF